MDWLKEMTQADLEELLDDNCGFVFAHCGLDTLASLWKNAPGITIYVSKKSYYKLAARYVRRHFAKCQERGESFDLKRLCKRLDVGERFIYDAIEETDAKDERQGKLL